MNELEGAPSINGLQPVQLLGSGGHANVYLYRQAVPERDVAVKVLASGVGSPSTFTAEANLMARVSAHPFIVSIFEARFADDGRPYIAMEYYPGLNLLERIRSERITVAEALRVGVQIASALETAHRAGILHRDVKPGNILTSEFGRPGLSDFGIASAEGVDAVDGVSIPWSPPEAFTTDVLDVQADVYSLAATVYHMLAGRSPFEVPGGHNESSVMIGRITSSDVPPIGRADVPPRLDRLLGFAMSKDPGHRPRTVAGFAHSLRDIETELRLSPTPLDLPRPAAVGRSRVGADNDSTEVREAIAVTTNPDHGASPITSEMDVPGPRTRASRGRKALVIGAVSLAGLGAAAVAGAVMSNGPDDPAPRFVEVGSITLDTMRPISGLTVDTTWMVTETGVPSGITTVVNSATETMSLQHDEVIPKRLIAQAGDVQSTPPFDAVVQDDPVVRYCLTLEPGGRSVISWTGPRLDQPVSDEELAELAVAWAADVEQVRASGAGSTCEAPDGPMVTAAETTTSAPTTSTSIPPTTTTTLASDPTTTPDPAPGGSTTGGGGGSTTGGGGGSTTGGGGGSTTGGGGGSTTGGGGGSTTGGGGGGSATGGTGTTATVPSTTTTTTIVSPPPPTDPPPPSGGQVRNVVGDDYSTGAGKIQADGFKPVKNSINCPVGQPPSSIFRQSPSGGIHPFGTTVTLDTCI